MAWDAGRGRAVLFGGRNGSIELDTTWEYDGAIWQQRFPLHVPPARFDAKMAYDRLRQRIVMFGGAGFTNLDDTWEWDGNDWTQIATAHAPSPRRSHVMAFDEARGVTMVYGGTLGWSGTWTYDGVDWTLQPAADPMPLLLGSAAVYSPYSHRVLMFGGSSTSGALQNDLWQWDGSAWTLLQQGVKPPPAVYHSMAYDRLLGGLVLLHGGSTWFWDGHWQSWAGTVPLGRSSGAMVHMDSLATNLLFGGARPVQPYPSILHLDDVWHTRFVAAQVPYGSGCGAPALSLVPSPTPPTIGGVWSPTIHDVPASPGLALLAIGLSRTTFAGSPLPLSMTPFGMTGCELLQDMAFAPGLFATSTGPTTAGVVLPIPPVPLLAGYRLYAQAWSLAPGANPAGVIASGAMTVVIGG